MICQSSCFSSCFYATSLITFILLHFPPSPPLHSLSSHVLLCLLICIILTHTYSFLACQLGHCYRLLHVTVPRWCWFIFVTLFKCVFPVDCSHVFVLFPASDALRVETITILILTHQPIHNVLKVPYSFFGFGIKGTGSQERRWVLQSTWSPGWSET